MNREVSHELCWRLAEQQRQDIATILTGAGRQFCIHDCSASGQEVGQLDQAGVGRAGGGGNTLAGCKRSPYTHGLRGALKLRENHCTESVIESPLVV